MKSAVEFVGYQGEGTLGRRILDGAKTVTLFGDEVYVNAKIYNLEGFSAHADRNGLLSWAKGFQTRPAAFFLVHGELESKQALAQGIGEATGISPVVVEGISEYEPGKAPPATEAQTMGDIVDTEDMEEMRRKIAELRDSLDGVFYRSRLALSEKNDPAVVSEISNGLLALEKDIFTLASIVTEPGSGV
jgi:metallo-beta-lactamase family protein